jgi:hypothetical protein
VSSGSAAHARAPGDQAPGEVGQHQRGAAGDDPDGVRQFLRAAALEREAARAGGQRAVEVVVVLERREHEHARSLRIAPDQRGGGGDAVHVGHPHIHDVDVRVRAGGHLQRLPHGPCRRRRPP